jgi:hypothetical protein
VSYAVGDAPFGLALGDVDLDSDPDLLAANYSSDDVTVLRSRTAGICIDNDADGYGSPASPACTFPQLDCDDGDPAVHPGAPEMECTGTDEDCSGGDYCPSSCAGSAEASTGQAPPVQPSSHLAVYMVGFVLPAAALVGVRIRRGRK